MQPFNLTWAEFKTIKTSKNMLVQYIDRGGFYLIFAVDGQLIFTCSVSKTDPVNGDQYDFESNYKTSANKPIQKKNSDGNVGIFSVTKPDISSTTIVSHDWCNKTTWYQGSIRVENETLSEVSGGTLFDSAHDYWIDLNHGNLYDEDSVSGYDVAVTVDDVVQATSGYSVDYVNGRVNFNSSPGGTVKAYYSYASSSVWVMKPLPGKILNIDKSEVQLSKDVTMTTSINFQIWINHPVYGMIKYQEIKYKNEKDVLSAANQGTGTVPAFGNLAQDTLVFPFNYITTKPFKSSIGAELRLCTDGDIAFSGTWATATLYVSSENE